MLGGRAMALLFGLVILVGCYLVYALINPDKF
ncbi:potassium-transporting ATPase subunit F [Clostridium sp.]